MLRVVLTGGIASGKSTVSQLFAELGTPIIDADVVSRELVEPGQPALQEIVTIFGADLLDEHSRLNRRRLRDLVFADSHARQRLEAILHPRIRQSMLRQADAVKAPYVILVVPLLAENGGEYPADRVLLVDIPEELQLRRLQDRDHSSEQQAQQMLAAQASRQQRLAIADDVIENTGDAHLLRESVKKLHFYYLQLAG